MVICLLTDKITRFFSNGKNGIPDYHNMFLEGPDNNIKHVLGMIDNPQTNGKLENFKSTVKRLKTIL